MDKMNMADLIGTLKTNTVQLQKNLGQALTRAVVSFIKTRNPYWINQLAVALKDASIGNRKIWPEVRQSLYHYCGAATLDNGKFYALETGQSLLSFDIIKQAFCLNKGADEGAEARALELLCRGYPCKVLARKSEVITLAGMLASIRKVADNAEKITSLEKLQWLEIREALAKTSTFKEEFSADKSRAIYLTELLADMPEIPEPLASGTKAANKKQGIAN